MDDVEDRFAGTHGESAAGGDLLSSLPALVLETIWSNLSYASRRHLRATCQVLRARLDADLLGSIVVAGPTSTASAVQPLLPHGFTSNSDPHASEQTPSKHPAVTGALHPIPPYACAPNCPSPHQAFSPDRDTTPGCNCEARPSHSPVPTPPATPPITTPAHTGRFCSLRTLVLSPSGAAKAACPNRSALPASLQPFFSPPPASLLAPFASSRSLTQLMLLDFVPGPSERDVATIASSFPALTLLHFLVSPGCTSRTAVPPLGALRACRQLRSLAVDLGRGSVMGSGARASLGLLTQLTRLVLGLADTGGNDLEAVACGTGGLAHSYPHGAAHHLHHLHTHHQHHQQGHAVGPGFARASEPASQQAAASSPPPLQHHPLGPAGCLAGGRKAAGHDGAGGAVVTALVSGVEASLYCLARANLRSLELRVVSFGLYERRLLQAVAAGSAETAAAAAAGASWLCGDACACGGHPSPDCSRDKGSSTVSSGLQRLCIRLMPSPHHAAASSASFAAGGSSGLGGAFGGGGLGGELATPSASLSCGPLALGNTSQPTVGWAQPSESELMLAALPALPGLEAVELPELLLTASHQLACLTGLTRLTELRLGGVVAAGVPAPRVAERAASGAGGGGAGRVFGAGTNGVGGVVSAAASRAGLRGVVLPGIRSLVVEAENPASYGGGSVPWWAPTCPALCRLSLTLQYGGAGGGTLGLRHHDGSSATPAVEQLAAALAGLPDVRLVICSAARAAAASTAAAFGPAARGANGGGLRHDLSVLLRRAPGVRHIELYSGDVTEILYCLPEDLLAVAPPPSHSPPGGAADCGTSPQPGFPQGQAMTGCGGICGSLGGEGPAGGLPGLNSLRLVTAAGLDALGAAAAASCVAKLCGLLTGMLQQSAQPLGCLCLSVPGLLDAWPGKWSEAAAAAAAAVGAGGGGGVVGSGAPVPGAVEALARAVAARGTRLCLCGLGSEQRAAVLQGLAACGAEVAEGRCEGGRREPPLHAVL